MEADCLELKVMDCRDLKAFNFFQKLSVYAVVSMVLASENPDEKVGQQQQRTPADPEGNGNPEWNHEMRLDLRDTSVKEYDRLLLHFDIRCHGVVVFGDKSIGEVRVPLKDLLIQGEASGIVRFVSYEVRTCDGKPNGVLNFSFKFKEKVKAPKTTKSDMLGIIDGYPTIHHHDSSSSSPETARHQLYPDLDEICNQENWYPPVETEAPYRLQAHYPPLIQPPPPPPVVFGSGTTQYAFHEVQRPQHQQQVHYPAPPLVPPPQYAHRPLLPAYAPSAAYCPPPPPEPHGFAYAGGYDNYGVPRPAPSHDNRFNHQDAPSWNGW